MKLTIAETVGKVRAVQRDERTAAVNECLAGSSLDAAVLQWRALLITALREAEVWPQGCKP